MKIIVYRETVTVEAFLVDVPDETSNYRAQGVALELVQTNQVEPMPGVEPKTYVKGWQAKYYETPKLDYYHQYGKGG
jgi:hypothetical protein